MKETLEKQIELLEKTKEQLKDQIKIFIEKSDNLDDKWDIFIKSKCGNHEPYYVQPDSIDWNKISLFDDFYIDRYGAITCNEMLEIIQDNPENFDWDDEKEIKFKEYFLNNFIFSFTNDW